MDLGFIGIGFSRPGRPIDFDRFTAWISAHKNADMAWLGKNIDKRENPAALLRGCRAVISLAYPYPSQKPGTPDGFRVSRYSQPQEPDYHYRLKDRCRELGDTIKLFYKGCRIRICVDSAPILEKSFAANSGIGFIGKNSLLIVPGHGSYVYLAEILTTAPLVFPPAKPVGCRCGTCSLCMDACPTGALERPFCLDASRCLSYVTIEYRGREHLREETMLGDCFFGCDRCQEVCPHNGDAGGEHVMLPSTDTFLEMEDENFKNRFGDTTLARAGLEKIKRNIRALRLERGV